MINELYKTNEEILVVIAITQDNYYIKYVPNILFSKKLYQTYKLNYIVRFIFNPNNFSQYIS